MQGAGLLSYRLSVKSEGEHTGDSLRTWLLHWGPWCLQVSRMATPRMPGIKTPPEGWLCTRQWYQVLYVCGLVESPPTLGRGVSSSSALRYR